MRRRIALAVTALGLAGAACGGPSVQVVGTGSDRVSGTATYREATTLPPDAELEVWLSDATAADPARIAEGKVLMRERDTAFSLRYDGERIIADHTYVLRAVVRVGGNVVYATEADTLVITRGHRDRALLVLRPVEHEPTEVVAPK